MAWLDCIGCGSALGLCWPLRLQVLDFTEVVFEQLLSCQSIANTPTNSEQAKAVASYTSNKMRAKGEGAAVVLLQLLRCLCRGHGTCVLDVLQRADPHSLVGCGVGTEATSGIQRGDAGNVPRGTVLRVGLHGLHAHAPGLCGHVEDARCAHLNTNQGSLMEVLLSSEVHRL